MVAWRRETRERGREEKGGGGGESGELTGIEYISHRL